MERQRNIRLFQNIVLPTESVKEFKNMALSEILTR
jgi:hypothetical protein